jgi:hypothetical protein
MWHGRVDKESTNNVIKSANRVICFAILRRCVWAGEARKNATLKEKVSIFKVVEFSSIVTLNKSYGKKEVNGNVSLKVEKYRVNIRFVLQWKNSSKMCKII